ncbi:uncharacterized protein EURHEDRAFT_416541 [Aspergillus ruber CBS 135680]|uniref:Solute carrier family 40 member n=1 Tax=Aspergillus ruber (strain CBS 135680) TaxID=1388766 RepID=A0A017S2M3_ASPRC|nr:uncharacterized protein EURHEDRAFT_416541 [Aspergillus ruber CBS 135680]EYE91293.1 hypothetical protein EURHEDRAFT_416541 [Aspergillus ruber CBS 135680]
MTATNQPANPFIARRLYISHFLSTWNSRVFEFGSVLYLACIFPNTLLPMSVYALARGASAVVFSQAVGWYIDTRDRLRVVRVSIVFQRLAVAASCVVFWLLATERTVPDLKLWLLGLLSLFACVEKLCDIMNTISVERDWVVVVAMDGAEALEVLNAEMRRIDLICKLVGPFVIAIIDGFSTEIAIVVNFVMNILSIFVEYYAIERVYQMVPSLQAPKQPPTPTNEQTSITTGHQVTRWSTKSFLLERFRESTHYFQHSVFLPSFAIALLNFTVLSFSGRMVAYLLSVGYNSYDVAIARSASVAVEISATWVGPLLMSRIGPLRAGMWLLSWQTVALAGAASAFFVVKPEILAATALVAGTIVSRVGMWGFSLSAQIIVQEGVEPENRGSFSSTEASWYNTFELLSYATTIFFSRPDQFHWPVLMSFIAVSTSCSLYAAFVRERTKYFGGKRDETLGTEFGYEALP